MLDQHTKVIEVKNIGYNNTQHVKYKNTWKRDKMGGSYGPDLG